MKEITLTRGYTTLIDDDDYAELSRHRWHVIVQKYNNYASRLIYIGKKQQRIYMHRAILSPPSGFVCDHIDGDGLNNQRNNLRPCTMKQNNQYSRKRKGTASQYKCVTPRRSGAFDVRIKDKLMGSFALETDAAREYDRLALELFGDFARTNFEDARSFDYAHWAVQAKKREADRSRWARYVKRGEKKIQFRGVFAHGVASFYIARLTFEKKTYYLGNHIDPVEAALAYDEQARELGFPSRLLNFPTKTLKVFVD